MERSKVIPKRHTIVIRTNGGDQATDTMRGNGVGHDIDMQLPLVFGGRGARVNEVLGVVVGGEGVGEGQRRLSVLGQADDSDAVFPFGRDERALELLDEGGRVGGEMRAAIHCEVHGCEGEELLLLFGLFVFLSISSAGILFW